MMTPEEKEKWIEVNRESKAILALEGLYPNEIDDAIEEAVLDGRVTERQAVEECLGYVKKHKTQKGFLESREWTK
ncbi:hypothetical protein A9G11_09170 [Gilliamella sp. wkB108]|uniref:hypothetical protein n=1 Tax=Gilliamella sp. wkB108 TaxID=3120256 RepID=UPI00080D9C5F|nr:hypothetical protein [Gilliamella apicola]OCG21096.1 hypothetical protein A9G11_09170 [Gilliamella apicola]